jgi:hypothetical protein
MKELLDNQRKLLSWLVAIAIVLIISWGLLGVYIGFTLRGAQGYDPTALQQQVDDLEHRLAACQGQSDQTRTLVTDLKKIHDADIVFLNTAVNELQDGQAKLLDSLDSLFNYVITGVQTPQ